MQVETVRQAIGMCLANFPMATNMKTDGTLLLWTREFDRTPDDLFITAVILCMNFCKMFPTVADIRQAIKDLQYEEKIKPKQLSWEVKRTNLLHQKIMDMTTGKTSTKEYLQSLDISELTKYARKIFPDISDELVLKNFTEFTQGLEQQNKCFACRTMKQTCDGWLYKHWVDRETGYVSNQMARCQKNIKHEKV